MNWNDFAVIFSTLTKNPIVTSIVILIIVFFWIKTDNGIGMAFRDIPKHSTEAIIATYNFVLSLLQREQISYPPNHDPPKNTYSAENDNAEKSFKNKIFSLLKKTKE